MRRSLWLLAVLLSIAGTRLPAVAQTCTLTKAANVAPGREVAISCANLQAKDTKVPVVLKSAKDPNKSISRDGSVQGSAITFSAPDDIGVYSVSIAVDPAKPIQVSGQIEVATPATIRCGKLPHVAPGQEVEVPGCNTFSGEQQDVPVSLKSRDGTVKPANDGVAKSGTLTFLVPSDTQPGQYSVTADNKPIQGQLDVMGPVVVDAIYPGTTYHLQKGFNFTISGKNFSTDPKGNKIELVDEGILENCKHNPPAADDTPCVASSGTSSGSTPPTSNPTSTTEIGVSGFYPKHYYGPVKMIVHVGDNKSAPASVTFAQVSQPGVVLAAAAVFFVVAYLLYRLVIKGMKPDMVNGIRATPFNALFLDRETNSYSLSKFQVIAWTAVTVYSYVYLFLCRTLIQGDFRFPDVSQNLPQLFFVSAGTTVAAAAITAAVGSKGAGPIQPSAADFISTGGLVAGDRFQFFTWTIVGCIGYLYLVIRMDPEKANISLPEIPQNFLYLMGVSSAGYLGGKLVRKPGPVIKVLSVAKITPPLGTPAPDPANQTKARDLLGKDFAPKDDAIKVAFPVLTLSLKGENLDPTGKIKVDDEPLRGDMFWINGEPDPQSHLCSEVNVSLNDSAQYIEGSKTHTLMLVNTDGQSATVNFPIDPMSIDPISGLTAGDKATDVTITGKNFVDGLKFEWRNPADVKADPTASGNATYKKPTELTVNLAPGTAGKAKLTLISQIGLRASADVTVAPPGPSSTSAASASATPANPSSPSTASEAVTEANTMSIKPLFAQKAGSDPVDVTVKGKNFVEGTKFEWRNPADATDPTTVGDATFKDATELSVNFAPGAAGTGKLTLISPTGQQVNANVTVS